MARSSLIYYLTFFKSDWDLAFRSINRPFYYLICSRMDISEVSSTNNKFVSYICWQNNVGFELGTYGVMVSTLDFESNNPSSILGMSFLLTSINFQIKCYKLINWEQIRTKIGRFAASLYCLTPCICLTLLRCRIWSSSPSH